MAPTTEFDGDRASKTTAMSKRTPSLVPWILLTLLAHAPTTWGQSAPPEARLEAEFDAICRQSRASANPFYTERDLEALQQQLAELERTRTHPEADLPVPAISEGELRGRLAFEYLRTGRFEDSRSQADTALARLEREEIRVPGLWGYLKEIEASALYQIAEDRNCLELGSGASCLLPVGPETVHEAPEFARAARDRFLELLERNPNRVSARWLANLSNLLAGDLPETIPASLRLPAGALLPREGVAFEPWPNLGPRVLPSGPDLAGGAVIDDFDGDGDLDLISSSMDPCAPFRALRRTGNGTFEEVAADWGLENQLGGLNLIHADFDDDGRLDLFVLRGAWFGGEGRTRNSLLLNRTAPDGQPRFEDVTVAAGLAYPAYPTQSAAAGDFDGDGDLDLVIANEAADIVIDPSQASNQVRSGYPLQLFRNELKAPSRNDAAGSRSTNLRFTDIASASGLFERGFSKGVAWGDVDNDGDLDLYVSNFGPNRLFLNEGTRDAPRFRDVAADMGVTGGDRRTFATWFFDFDQDGDLDLFTASYNVPSEVIAGNLLGLHLTAPDWSGRPDRLRSNPLIFRNVTTEQEGPGFRPASEELGLDFPVLAMGANFADLDNDGDPDIVLGTGMPDISAVHPNVVLRNEGGTRFTDITFASGMAHLQKGHGVAFGDIDRDGDLDLFHQLGGAFPYDHFDNALFVNPTRSASRPETGTDARTEAPGFVVLRLRGRSDNHYGLGARIRLEVRDGQTRRTIHTQVGSGGSFGGSSLEQVVGLAAATAIEQLEVTWPSGATQIVTGLEPGSTYEIVQGEERARPVPSPPQPLRPILRSVGDGHDQHHVGDPH